DASATQRRTGDAEGELAPVGCEGRYARSLRRPLRPEAQVELNFLLIEQVFLLRQLGDGETHLLDAATRVGVDARSSRQDFIPGEPAAAQAGLAKGQHGL